MAILLYRHKGYSIYQAAFQPSKKGIQRSLQIIKSSMIKKNIRYKVNVPGALGAAYQKAKDWIDSQDL